MKIYIDIPNNFSVPTYGDHADVKQTYQNLFSAAVKLNLETILFKAEPFVGSELKFTDGIYYAYHARNPQAHAYCVKAGALPGLWYFDAGGYSGWCSLANDRDMQERSAEYDLQKADETIVSFKRKFIKENLSRQRQLEIELEPDINNIGDFLFYPLQVNSDEVLKLGRFAQFEVIGKLAELGERYGLHVVLKRHPLCDSELIENVLRDVLDSPFVHVSRSSIHKLIPASRAVLVSNSGVGLEALIHGKTVYSLAKSEYAHMTIPVSSVGELETALLQTPPAQSEKVRRQLGYLLNVYWVDVSREEEIVKRIQEHVALFRESVREDNDDEQSIVGRRLSILHRAEKELSDIIDFMLMTYPKLSDDQKEKISPILARAAISGLKTEQILRQSDARVWRRCVHYFRRSGDLDTAEALARKVVNQAPADSGDQLALSKVLFDRGQRVEGLECSRKAADDTDPTTEALVYYGRRLLSGPTTERQRALAYAEKALSIDPGFAIAHWLKARALLYQGDIEGALGSSLTALAQAPENPSYLKLRQQILDKVRGKKVGHAGPPLKSDPP